VVMGVFTSRIVGFSAIAAELVGLLSAGCSITVDCRHFRDTVSVAFESAQRILKQNPCAASHSTAGKVLIPTLSYSCGAADLPLSGLSSGGIPSERIRMSRCGNGISILAFLKARKSPK